MSRLDTITNGAKATWEGIKWLADALPQGAVKLWDIATDGNKIASTKKDLDTAQKEYRNTRHGRAQANKDVTDRQADFDKVRQNLTDREQLLRQSQDYLSNVITHPDIQRLFDAAANTTDPLARSRLSEQLVTRLTPYWKGDKQLYSTDPQMDRALAFLDYMYPNIYQRIYSNKNLKYTVDDVYDAILTNAAGARDFTDFSSKLLNQARLGANNAQAAYDAERLIAQADPNYLAAEKALNDANVNASAMDALARVNRGEWNQSIINHRNAIANQARKIRNTRLGFGLSALGGLGYALYPSAEEEEEQGQNNDIQGRSPALPGMMPAPASAKEIFNAAAGRAMADNPLAHMGSYYTSRNSDWTPDDSALEYIPDPEPALIPKPASAPSAPSRTVNVQPVENTISAPMTKKGKVVIPDGLYPNSIKGTREWLLAQHMADYRKQSARNALPPGISPAEGVQRGIIPYEALQYF